jgi:cytochrome c oxidase subunit 4
MSDVHVGGQKDHAAHDEVHESHPGWSTYWRVAVVLTAITAVEVWIYYIPAFVRTSYFVPVLLVLSAIKFTIVVLFYMHLKYDNKIYRALFAGPFAIAVMALIGLLFLFGKVAVRIGLLRS